jgi:competence ComEA-like helix-hairpin-helix protein
MQRAPFFALGMAAFALVASTLIAAATAQTLRQGSGQALRRSSGQAASQEPSKGASAADDPAAGLFVQMCVKCHDAARITAIRRTSTEWEEVLNKMIEKGATGTEKDFESVYGYLLRNFGKLNINLATPDDIAMILGLSDKDAQRIVAYRKANGSFADFEAVKKVPDIDLGKLDEHKDAITF